MKRQPRALAAAVAMVRRPAIDSVAADHKAGRAEHGRTLWQLVTLDHSLARLFG